MNHFRRTAKDTKVGMTLQEVKDAVAGFEVMQAPPDAVVKAEVTINGKVKALKVVW